MMFILCWLLMVLVWAAMIAALGFRALLGFALGVIVVIATSLAVGLAAAATHDRGNRWDS
jgi:hypothetical protein